MERKTRIKLIAILMIITIVLTDFLVIGSNLITFATKQFNKETSNSNIEFSAYFKNGEERNFDVRFNGNEVDRYEVSLVEDVPDKSNIINILGWELDLTNFFGLDLTKIFPWLKEGALELWNWFTAFCSTIPLWAWLIAGGIVIWNLPSKYLFGIFP